MSFVLCVTFYFDTTSNLQKYKKNTKNYHISFTKIHQLFMFYPLALFLRAILSMFFLCIYICMHVFLINLNLYVYQEPGHSLI